MLGVRVADLGVKEALIADDPAVYFTTPHFDGFPAVLVRLDGDADRRLRGDRDFRRVDSDARAVLYARVAA